MTDFFSQVLLVAAEDPLAKLQQFSDKDLSCGCARTKRRPGQN
jgi:hypothetical protein